VSSGEKSRLPFNTVLTDAVRFGMHLTYIDRATYRAKASPEVEAALRKQFG
jgi:1-aminocyclopropane-1-carboxylate deaminase